MDSDTSIASMTVARFRGVLASAVGPAIATVSNTKATRITAVGRCRNRPGRFGATLSSNSKLAKRRVCRRVRRCATTYPTANAATRTPAASQAGCAKFTGDARAKRRGRGPGGRTRRDSAHR